MLSSSGWPYEAADATAPTREEIVERPAACALPKDELTARKQRLRAEFAPNILEIQEIEDGCVYWFRRSEEDLRRVLDFALFESRCCSFVDFGIGLSAGGDRISLRISGPRGAAIFLKRDGDLDAPPSSSDCGCC